MVSTFKNQGMSVDGSAKALRFYGRYFGNAMALIVSDALMVVGSVFLANVLLWWINDIPITIKCGWIIVPVWTLVSAIARLLPGWGVGVVDELRRIHGALFVMFSTLLVFSFFLKSAISPSRIVFLFSYLFCSVLIPLARSFVRRSLGHLGRWGVPVSIYGDVASVSVVIRALRAEPALGYIPSVIFTNDLAQGNVVNGVVVRGGLLNTTKKTPVGIVASREGTRPRLIDILEGPLETYRRVIIVPDLIEAPSLWVVPRDLQGMLGLEITKNLLNPFARVFKRTVDLTLVIAASPLWAPLMLFLYVLIWLEDRKNPMFMQPRLGRGGRVFRTAKFRTMVPNAEKALQKALARDPALKKEWEAHFKLKKDPRITKVGRFLRKTSLDEIPQILNVLDGSMSLVGPRPLPEYHFMELPEQVRFLRDKVRPGITGLWQVSGRSEAGNAGMEKWDPYYVRNWSIWLDFVILFRTVKAVFRQEGAY